MPWHNLPVNDVVRHCEGGNVHLRMLASNLSKGTFEPSSVGVGNIVKEFRLGFLEVFSLYSELLLSLLKGFTLFGELILHLAQLHLPINRALFKIGHFSFVGRSLFLKFHHLST